MFTSYYVSSWLPDHVYHVLQYVYVINLGLQDLCCAPLQQYMATLCTIDLHCALPTCVVHCGSSCTYQSDGAQYKVVSLDELTG